MDKKKVLIIGGGAIAAGALLYSQRGKDSPMGTAGSIIAAPIESITGAEDTGVSETGQPSITDILGGLPITGEGGSMLPHTPSAAGLGYGIDPTTIATKKRFSLPTGLGGGIVKIGAGATRLGATGVMAPVQILGGGAARATDRGIRYAMGSGYHRMVSAQKKRVARYPRASHAVSMVTGGATRRAPISKKQQSARKKYPRVYKAWKSIFKYVGA